MEYRFGPNKPRFNGTDEEWNKLQTEIAYWVKDLTIYPSVEVICPHCGSKNIHTDNGKIEHRMCNLQYIYKNGKRVWYDCPGYLICQSSPHK